MTKMTRLRVTALTLASLVAAGGVGCDKFVFDANRKKAMELANQGVEQFRSGLYDSAERTLRLAVQTDGKYVLGHYNLAKVYQKQRKWKEAAESFENAVELEPSNANYQYDLGESYLEMMRLEEAERVLAKASEMDERLFKAHWRLGAVRVALDKPKEADAALRRAIEANPRFDKPFVDLGHLYMDYDAIEAAAQVFGECVRANEASAECHNGHGLALKDAEKYDAAAESFKKALQIEPGLYIAIYNAGMTYAEWFERSRSNDHKEQARQYLQKYVTAGGGKNAEAGFVKAASDKLYALGS